MRTCRNCLHVEICWVVKTFTEIIETTIELYEGTGAVLDVWGALGNNCKQFKDKGNDKEQTISQDIETKSMA